MTSNLQTVKGLSACCVPCNCHVSQLSSSTSRCSVHLYWAHQGNCGVDITANTFMTAYKSRINTDRQTGLASLSFLLLWSLNWLWTTACMHAWCCWFKHVHTKHTSSLTNDLMDVKDWYPVGLNLRLPLPSSFKKLIVKKQLVWSPEILFCLFKTYCLSTWWPRWQLE